MNDLAARVRATKPALLTLARRRLIAAVVILVAVSVLLFALAAISPFDPLTAMLGSRVEASTEAQREAMARALGTDRPWWQTWGLWMAGLVTGDLGWSRTYGQPVAEVFAQRAPWTLLLSGTGLIGACLIAAVAGVAAVRPRSWANRAVGAVTVIIQSLPPFVWAMGAITLFAVTLHWFPIAGVANPGQSPTAGSVAQHLLLPATVLAVTQAPWLVMILRDAIAETIETDALRGARLRGLSPVRMWFGHVLPVAVPPALMIIGTRLPELLVGAVLVETIFSWPGLASSLTAATMTLDFPLLAAITLTSTALVLIGSWLSDSAHLFLDPRLAA